MGEAWSILNTKYRLASKLRFGGFLLGAGLIGFAAGSPVVSAPAEVKTVVVTRNVEVPGPAEATKTVQAGEESDQCKQLAGFSTRVYQIVESQSAQRGKLTLLLKNISTARQLDDQLKLNEYKSQLEDLAEQSSQSDQDLVRARSDLQDQIKKCER